MSIHTWDSGIGGTVAGMMYMLMFVFAILLGIVQGGLRLNVGVIIGIWIVFGSLYMWCFVLWKKLTTRK